MTRYVKSGGSKDWRTWSLWLWFGWLITGRWFLKFSRLFRTQVIHLTQWRFCSHLALPVNSSYSIKTQSKVIISPKSLLVIKTVLLKFNKYYHNHSFCKANRLCMDTLHTYSVVGTGAERSESFTSFAIVTASREPCQSLHVFTKEPLGSSKQQKCTSVWWCT